jgi:hypothetical protein
MQKVDVNWGDKWLYLRRFVENVKPSRERGNDFGVL